MKALFICCGNVCRSQIAEGYYNFFTKSNNASSAGISDSTPLKHSHPTKEVIQIMEEEGIDTSKKIVKSITKEMVDSAGRIFIMCPKERCPKFLLDSNKNTFWDIDDPYDTSIDNHRRVRDEIKKRVGQLIEK
ncbi:MAG: low molecular weight phosphatase family protein [Proteobacteria bacterium]|nr:low molecular weight phosphatase family protein [Pseudomonadota bacterium]